MNGVSRHVQVAVIITMIFTRVAPRVLPPSLLNKKIPSEAFDELNAKFEGITVGDGNILFSFRVPRNGLTVKSLDTVKVVKAKWKEILDVIERHVSWDRLMIV